MLNHVIAWSLRNVFLVLLATLAIVIGGVYALSKMPLDALPDLSDAQVIVYTEYPGQAPQVVEDQVLSANDGNVERATIKSRAGFFLFWCFFCLYYF